MYREEVLHKKIAFHRQPHRGDSQTGRGRRTGAGAVPRVRHEQRHLLQVASQARRHERFADGSAQGAGGGEPAAEEDVRRGASEGRDYPGGDGKKVMRPSSRRERAGAAVERPEVSIRLACEAFRVSETGYRYQPKLSDENAEIADWLIRLTHNQRNWGFGLCFLFLRNVKGFGWNYKRVYRIYRALELNLRIKPKRRLVREKPEALAVPESINQVWSMDFMHDRLEDGRAIRLFNVSMTSIAKGWASKWTSRCRPSG